jgi:plasmid stabilization system protein ParE
MTYNVVIEQRAKLELNNSAQWYEDKSPGLGARFIDAFLAVIDYLEIHAHIFPKIEGEYRQVVMKIFPFVVVFKIVEEEVRIIAVFHTSRNPEKKTSS